MSSTLIFKQKQTVYTKQGLSVEIRMDLYKIDGPHGRNFPEGYRFSWVAFETFDPTNRVLFDCHPPKGPHLHLGQDPEGTSFEWKSLEKAIELFWEKIWEHFGEQEGEDSV